MRRITKKLVLIFLGVLFSIVYCEYLIYYVVVVQCRWPFLNNDLNINQTLKSLIIADPHLLGPYRGHWLDKWRREWQMQRAFQAIVALHQPEVVFVLGDLFDEGEWTNDIQFEDYVERFYKLFAPPEKTKLVVAVGNHDIGFHNKIRRGNVERFDLKLNTSSVQLFTFKDIHFVIVNSMAMEGDNCRLCTEARRKLENISEIFSCAENPNKCKNELPKINYSRPIFMQHFPMYRISDSVCTEPDAPPIPLRNKRFRLKIDALSKESTEYIVSKIKPRVVFGGHTHHGCVVHHSYKQPEKIEFDEHSVPSFSWRNRPDPKYMLVTFSTDVYGVNKCGLPRETTIAITGVVMLVIVIFLVVKAKSLGRLTYC